MAEMKQNKIEHVLAYREQVPRSGRVLESFLGYSDKLMLLALLFIDAYFRSLAHRMRYKTEAFNPIFASQADFDPL